ncbi:MAG: hypothetical protein IID45_08520, partial [Planctomycetes bacterium]|nr:hypothetical protein [Planctomycetota bacterium]
MMDLRLARQMRPVTLHIRLTRLLSGLSLVWLTATVIVGCVWWVGLSFGIRTTTVFYLAAGGAALILAVGWTMRRCRRVGETETARKIESRFPDLQQKLITAAEQTPDSGGHGLSFLQQCVIEESLVHNRLHSWKRTISFRRIAAHLCLMTVSLSLFVAMLAGWLRIDGRQSTAETFADPVPQTMKLISSAVIDVSVEPGDTSVERGTDLLVVVRFKRRMPVAVALVFQDANGRKQTIPLRRQLNDPLFAGRLAGVTVPGRYHVEYDGGQTKSFRVRVFDFPALERVDATVVYPDYTKLKPKTVSDALRVSFVQGSRCQLKCKFNKSGITARLVDVRKRAISLNIGPDGARVGVVELMPRKSVRYRLELVDSAGRRNRFPPEIVIDVLPNRRPRLKLTFPGKDVRVSPLEELSLEAVVRDDFGLREYGLVYRLSGRRETRVVLGGPVAGGDESRLRYRVSLEALQAAPDELVSYYFYADDADPDG